jgi:Leucine-rich repeat (LRR) protein
LGNELSILGPGLEKLKNLETLVVRACGISEISKDFCQLKNIISLDLGENKLSMLPECFSEQIELRKLDLDNNCLTSLLSNFSDLHNLRDLDLSNNINLLELPESFTKLKNLATLKIVNCPLDTKALIDEMPQTEILV